jgi:NDP-sugar pyrophosphorylase family protein
MVLAAGYGSRLRPLTALLPKPVLPVLGRPLVAWTLERLARVGAEQVVLNLHHHGDTIRAVLGDALDGLPIRYSPEAELLGTWGALEPVREELAAGDVVLLLNADSLCRWPLETMLRRHREQGAAATILLAGGAKTDAFGGGVGIDVGGFVVDFGRTGAGTRRVGTMAGKPPASVARRVVFAGAHVLSPELLQRLPRPGVAGDIVEDLYQPMLRRGERIATVVTQSPWHDLGTPRRYLEAIVDTLRHRSLRRFRRRWVASGARVGRGARIVLSAVEAGAEIGAGTLIEHSVVLSGARVGAGSRLRNCIIAPGVALPDRSVIEGRMVTPLRGGRHPGGGDSVVGTLVFSPLGDDDERS